MFYTHFERYGYDRVIYVLEEIDTLHRAFLRRSDSKEGKDDAQLLSVIDHIKTLKAKDEHEDEERSDKLSITDILEAFDGLCEARGLIIVATTNHIEKLDPAVVRRFGLRLRMGLLCRETFQTIITRHYQRYVSDDEWAVLESNVVRMTANNMVDLCSQAETWSELSALVGKLDLGNSKTLVDSEQTS
jgi:SpoVK/Ycf46/Vps4 family AAA+-type ATPase